MANLTEYKKSIWTVMLATGVSPELKVKSLDKSLATDSLRNRPSDYMGFLYSIRPNPQQERNCIIAIDQHGIDWDATSDPASGEHSEFMGTDEDPAITPIMEGWLVTNDGIYWPWISSTIKEQYGNIMELIVFLTDVDEEKAFQKAVEKVRSRL